MRGVAVLVMIEWHAIDAWTLPLHREGGVFWIFGFVGGWAAPLFLFLAGLAVPLAGTARLARGRLRRVALLEHAYCWEGGTPARALVCETCPASSPQSVVR